MCENLELFDEYTATLFSTLYQTFPVKQIPSPSIKSKRLLEPFVVDKVVGV